MMARDCRHSHGASVEAHVLPGVQQLLMEARAAFAAGIECLDRINALLVSDTDHAGGGSGRAGRSSDEAVPALDTGGLVSFATPDRGLATDIQHMFSDAFEDADGIGEHVCGSPIKPRRLFSRERSRSRSRFDV